MKTLFPTLFLLLLLSFSNTALANGPAVSISVSPTVITDQGEDAFFYINLSSPATRSIAVQFQVSGSALPGTSYTLVGNFKQGRITINPGESSAVVQLHTFDVDGPAFLTAGITLVGGSKYHLGSPRSASIRIDNVR